MNTSEQIDQLATALAKAHEELANPVVNAKNPHFGNKYVDLAEGLNTIRTTFAKHGLSFVQTTSVVDDIMYLTTRLLHLSGQWLEGVYPVCRLGKPQDMGSATTYARRYSIFAMAGIAGDKDDDGEGTRKATVDTRKATVDNWAPTRKALEASVEQVKRETSNALKKNEPDLWPTIEKRARAAKSVDELTALWNEYEELYERMPKAWQECMWDEFARLTSELDPVPA